MAYYFVNLETRAGKVKYAEILSTIGGKLLTSSLLALFGSGIANELISTSGSNFWILYSLSVGGIVLGLRLLFAGANQYDKAHRE